jgi:type II secretory pathway component PulF
MNRLETPLTEQTPQSTESREQSVLPVQAPAVPQRLTETAGPVGAKAPGQLRALPTRQGTLHRAQEQARRRPAPRKTRKERAGDALFLAFYGSEGPGAEYADFCANFASLLASGWTTAEALVHAARRAGPGLQRICADAAPAVAQGAPLSQALLPYRGMLPEIMIPMLQTGETSGTLEQAVRRLGEAFRESVAIGHTFDINPLGVQGLFRTGGFYWEAGRMPEPGVGSRLRDQYRLLLPMVGMAGRCLGGARWARTLAALWKSGVPIPTALETSARTVYHAHYAAALRQAAERTRNGQSLRASLIETRWLPPHLLDSIETGELTGELDVSLNQLAERLEADARDIAGKVAFLMLILLVALVAAAGIVFLLAAVSQH